MPIHAALRAFAAAAMLGIALAAGSASAELVLNQVIVDLAAGGPPRGDIEASNTGKERIYVVVEPVEIVHPGRADEARVPNPDPAALGLLVTPQKMILEPGERKLIRIASIVPRTSVERIYRVTVKPVVGEVNATGTALKILVGYDVLVIVRPMAPTGVVTGTRAGTTLTLANTGTTNVEVYEGRQCNDKGADCRSLPARRLYAGATWQVPVDATRPVDYKVKIGTSVTTRRF